MVKNPIQLQDLYCHVVLFVDGMKTVEGRCAVGDYNK